MKWIWHQKKTKNKTYLNDECLQSLHCIEPRRWCAETHSGNSCCRCMCSVFCRSGGRVGLKTHVPPCLWKRSFSQSKVWWREYVCVVCVHNCFIERGASRVWEKKAESFKAYGTTFMHSLYAKLKMVLPSSVVMRRLLPSDKMRSHGWSEFYWAPFVDAEAVWWNMQRSHGAGHRLDRFLMGVNEEGYGVKQCGTPWAVWMSGVTSVISVTNGESYAQANKQL